MKRVLLTLGAALVMTVPAHAIVTFNFIYTDAGTGFNDPGLGAERRGALERAAETFGSTALEQYDATIDMSVSGDAPPLASAGSQLITTPDTGGGIGRIEVIRNKIQSNGANDLNGPELDGSMSWNFDSTTWELQEHGIVDGTEFDFFSTAYHELTHAIGWFDTIGPVFGDDIFGFGVNQPGD